MYIPFQDWSKKFHATEDEPVPPKFDLNAVDLYIPCMAYVTYIFMAGIVLGE